MNVLKLSFSFEILYTVTTGLVKYSILLFYKRLFPQRSVRITLWTIGAIVLAWQVAGLLAFFFQCKTLHNAWDFTTSGECIDISKLWIGNAITNIIMDLILVALPMPLIWNLQITKNQKVALSGVFLVGALLASHVLSHPECLLIRVQCSVSAASFVRLANLITVTPVDISCMSYLLLLATFLSLLVYLIAAVPHLCLLLGNYVGVGIWSAVEPSIGLVSACLPSMRFLLKLLVQRLSRRESDDTESSRRPNEENIGISGNKTDIGKTDVGVEGVERMERGIPVEGGVAI